MNATRTMLIALALAFGGAVHAQGCSGGADGGMDATGSQCSDPRAVVLPTGTLATTTDVAAARGAVPSISRMARKADAARRTQAIAATAPASGSARLVRANAAAAPR